MLLPIEESAGYGTSRGCARPCRYVTTSRSRATLHVGSRAGDGRAGLPNAATVRHESLDLHGLTAKGAIEIGTPVGEVVAVSFRPRNLSQVAVANE